jgi:SH3 domain protein
MDSRLKSRLGSALITTLIALALPTGVAAETVYISDALTVPLRSGPSNAYRILHRGLPSGTQMEVLTRDSESGFTQIRTNRGTEGWIPEQYLVDEPIARHKLVQANREMERLKGRLSKHEQQLNTLGAQKSSTDQSNNSLQNELSTLETEIAEIKQISAGAIAEHATNLRLNELNERLRDEIEALVGERDTLKDNAQERWLMIGAGLVLLGFVLGIVIKARPRRSAWS